MSQSVHAYLVTGPDTAMWFSTHEDRGFVALSMGAQHGSELRIHLRPAEIDRLSGVLEQAREALCGPAVKAAA